MKLRIFAAALVLTGYLLGVSRGYVAVWQGEDPQPWLITKMPVFLLPREDAEKLKAGIPIPDGYTLTQALEDYCS